MKRFSKALAMALTLCIFAGLTVILASAGQSTLPSVTTDNGKSKDFESLTGGSSYTADFQSGSNSAGTYSTVKIVDTGSNKYLQFAYKKDASEKYRRDGVYGVYSATDSSSLTHISDYSYITLDFELAADQYRYLIDEEVDSGEVDEEGNPIKTTVTKEYLSATDPSSISGAYGIRLAYSNNSTFTVDNRATYTGKKNNETSGYNTLNIKLVYNESDGLWHVCIYNYLKNSTSTSPTSTVKDTGYTLSNNLGEWNHFTYAIKRVVKESTDTTAKVTYGYSEVHLYYNGHLLGKSYINTNSSWNYRAMDIVPRGVNWQINNCGETVSPHEVKYSMAIDNFIPTYYPVVTKAYKDVVDGETTTQVRDPFNDVHYTSGADVLGIDDLFIAGSGADSILDCEDVVYNASYVPPVTGGYAELDGEKFYGPSAMKALMEKVKNGSVVTTSINLNEITPPAWTSFTVNCDAKTIVTLSNEAIARGTTIEKTDTGYAIEAGIKVNMTLFADMRFNLYLPKIDGITIKSVEGVSLEGATYWINGIEMLRVWAKVDVADFETKEAKIIYTLDGKDCELKIALDVLAYAKGVANIYECGSKEARLIYEIINYKESVATYLDPEFADESGRLAAFKSLYASHKDCSCADTTPNISAEEINVDYSALKEKGITGISYQLSLNETGMVIYTSGDATVSSVSYENALGEIVTHTVDDGSLVKYSGYYFVKNISAANIRRVMTITVDDASGTYSLGRYIHNNPDVSAAKSLYTYSIAAENYKNIIIPYKASHLILNADGSYGGSISKELYGEGAPLNGKYDVDDSDYYTVNSDYYNMSSTSERVIFPSFSSYQQTMQDSSGLACLMMILNYMGEDVNGEYSELALLNKYQEINSTTVYGKGTTEKGLINLVESLGLGYTAEKAGFDSSAKEDGMKSFLTESIKEGKFVLVRYQSPVGYSWKLVIGYDNLGNIQNTKTEEYYDHIGDDVVIFAEPYDGYDHCQDGYATERARNFYLWWRDMEIDGTVNEKYSYIVIDPNLDIEFDYQPVDETVKQELYDIHLPLNPDGTYGGTRNASKYGSITSGRGWWNHTDSNYYKISDFYNMGSEGSRILLTNYTVLQQTMGSSCGLCAVTSVFKYYGAEGSYYDWELEYLNHYEAINPDEGPVKGRGSSTVGNATAIEALGYEVEYGLAEKGNTPKYDTYERFTAFVAEQLLAGRPIVVTTNFGGGHFLTIIGYDDMGTDYVYDDVIVTADSCDYWDGYQDGYSLYSAYKFFTQFTNGSYSKLQQHIVIYDNKE